MPRIPVSHTRTARYINGSHFAILWVNSRGETEQYASELFQPKLGAWFNQDVIVQARQMVSNAGEAQATQESGLSHFAEREMEDDDAHLEAEDEDGLEQEDQLMGPTIITWDRAASDMSMDKRSSDLTSGAPLQIVDYTTLVKQRALAPELRRTFSMPSALHDQNHPNSGSLSFRALPGNKSRPMMLDIKAINEDHHKFHLPQGPPDSSNPEYRPLTIGDHEEVTGFLETRFRQLQQLVCKIVAKAWIKVIEPKKQTRYPYNKGEDSKPAWWPEDVRHKEPDHLKKIERITLLMTMLRCGKVPTNRLELATAEVAAFIPPDKINLLREIYRVGREEERFRCHEIPAETKIFVAATASINSLGMDDLNSPSTAGIRPNDDMTPQSAGLDAHMTLQRSLSHSTVHFDEHDPFTQTSDLQQNFAMLPPQQQQQQQQQHHQDEQQPQHNFYYPSSDQSYARQSNAAVMSTANHALSSQSFQRAQQQQMFVAQQVQSRRQSTPAPIRTPQGYTATPWPQNLEPGWHQPNIHGIFEQPDLDPPQMSQSQHQMTQPTQTFTYTPAGPHETPAKQTQLSHQNQQALRSSPYLPTPLRPEGTFSATRGQGVSFSDYLNSPRTVGPGPMHEVEHLQNTHDGYH
ncbi:Ydr124wp-like protein [Taphrina deformans PYCC 5710]|uniref:Ydr124wp-like protein n=1 Tax=Taphrina deformans (strain PYCC 5710 / ATCC 11124 / CBS 356.35 / IMI 108563 / JCM 9778 / NBRC 8474) TaxID=1097556 RepID=R4XG77_TAPDE|nr:Ydr124wp-like protein [Taphrina deformans PYCC 5710]|eukprot:CCG82389.1 Ydr124wp-like protein [Taphrina deformans PYCC 5710]